MKPKNVLKMLLLWIAVFLPLQAGAEDLGALRLSEMEGDVQIKFTGLTEWDPAAINLPLRAGDRLWVPQNAWVQVETREGSVVRLDAGSLLEILEVEEDSLQLYLSQGQAYLRFKQEMDSMIQVDTPVSSIRMYDSSTLNVAIGDNGYTEISVFRGAVYAENRSGEVRVAAGKMLSMDDGLPSLMTLGPPSDWERWNRQWDDSLSDAEDSEQYLPPELTGYGRDLSRNGRWVQTSEYGYVWTPTTHISVDWAPYRYGRWVWVGDDYVWIAQEPWGWAPYHYGRWSYISSHGWCWVPPPRNEVYWGPGYVSWVATADTIAWVPLAPAEIYYGHGYYGPHSINILTINISIVVPGRNYRNVHVRDAVTVVHRDTFLGGQRRDIGQRENPFLRERVSIGRPRIEPERTTMMPIVREIPREHKPPRSIQERTVNGERRIVRERDRSVFRPTEAPRSLFPAIRINPEAVGESRRTAEPGGRQQVQEEQGSPGQLRERPTNNRGNGRDSIRSVPVRPQLTPAPVPVVPVPAKEQPALREEQEAAPASRGRQQVQEEQGSPGQLRERPTNNRGNGRDSIRSVPVRPQLTPVPVPAALVPVIGQPVVDKEEELKRLQQQQQAAEAEAVKQAAEDKVEENSDQRRKRIRPALP
ncbi:MAG: FecR domain-containing protein [Desulfoarculaceae bacterium]|nr:FecR domain-containing protein [Desulfoarculaceae bacterium]